MSSDVLLQDDDGQYVSSQDSDFAPEEAQDVGSDESDVDEPAAAGAHSRRTRTRTRTRTRPRPSPAAQAREKEDYDNSGDEAVLLKGQKLHKRAQEKGRADQDEGGLVKTRAQRAAEKAERKHAANHAPVTVDVDALWAQMVSGKPASQAASQAAPRAEDASGEAPAAPAWTTQDQPQPRKAIAPPDSTQPAMVRIQRTYNFAGQVHSEEKVVARDSAEARLYLASQGQGGASLLDASPTTRRATRKAFRSAFEPVLDSGPGRTDLVLGMAARLRAGKEAQAKKLNTVEKSKMDWAGYVDKEGIKDELELASRSKDSYAARQDFLARSEAIRENDARAARMAGRA
ncbi:uncharacterized protein UV8b_02832 [Ustilaginoidea virens]|uniref:SWR1-complex protein 5 n=1 Tax=Ustilaginoidea virens TaxID=1159556 RepID=A0A8E5MGH1_USTVR|nr:uncharacterized protein UV8b_02832 [Ustilaginoidea virens]QUC18591.1 hypothetical protein UV8b_02832 [Ustilaginoidea virens]